MVICGVCFIGKWNQPLCFRSYREHSDLAYQSAFYTALDVVESLTKHQETGGTSPMPPANDSQPQLPARVATADSYLGYLCPALTLSPASVLPLEAFHRQNVVEEDYGDLKDSELSSSQQSCFASHLLPRDLAVFGYITPTRLKILVVIEERPLYHDWDLRPFFRHLHRLYADCIANPFFVDTLDTPKFLQNLDACVNHYSRLLSTD